MPSAKQWAAGQRALERNRRETWLTGLPRFSQLTVCRGRIFLVPAKDTGVIHTELWGSGVYLHIGWFLDEIPPTIHEGDIATIIGNIQTYNLNSHISVQNCLHVPRYGAQLGKEVRALISKYVLTPKTYVPEDRLEVVTQRIKDAQAKRRALTPKKQ